jgi:hypothetical protein
VLSLTVILLAVWALVALGVVVLCVAARRTDREIAGELPATPRVTRVPARAVGRVVAP